MAADPTQRDAHRALPRAGRLERMLGAADPSWVWCGRELAPGHRDASIEHVVPRLKGGPAWPENEVVARRACNRAREHASPTAWLERCEALGLPCDRARVQRALVALRDAIARRGGQRRARPYLEGQLRRLGV